MSDFLGARGRDLFTGKPVASKITSHKRAKNVWDIIDRKLEKRRTAPTAVAPRSKGERKPRKQPSDKLERTLRDFRGALDAVRGAVELLGKKDERRASPADGHRRPLTTPRFKRAPATPIQKIIEREMRILTRVSEKIPTAARHTPPTTSFQSMAHKALEAQIPQTFAKLLHAEKEVRAARASTPQAVLRPSKGSPVASLMKVAKAIRAGRLPFVPRETKKRAQELLNAVKRHRGNKSSPAALNKTIERQRLIPLAVTHELKRIKQPSNAQQQMGKVVTERMRLTQAEARKLSTSIPRFEGEGAVVGGGSVIMDAGESRTRVGEADVIQGADSPYAQGYEAPAAPGHSQPAMSTDSAPMAPQHKAPASAATTDESRTSGGLGGKTGGGTVGAGGSGPMQIKGELTIAGLAQWIAKLEGELKGV